MGKVTQKDRIRKYIADYGSITPFQAFADLGVTKLSTRISEMIQEGEQIKKIPMKSTNRYGETISFMRYEKAV